MNAISKTQKTTIAIGIVWLFHLSAVIGISLGYEQWFMSKSPLNLLLCSLLFVLIYPLDSLKKLGAFLLFFCSGMLVEWLGVNYQLVFGDYQYGSNLGLKLDGVPLLIGMYWSLLTFITASLASWVSKPIWLRAIIGASLMVLLDYFMEHSAPIFDFWEFAQNQVPLENYLSWFGLAFVLHLLFHLLKLSGNLIFSLHLYLAQLLFFMYFYVFF